MEEAQPPPRNALTPGPGFSITGKPIEVPAIDEATPLGAAILAGIGVGIYRDEEDAFERVRKPSRTFEPDPRVRSAYEEGFARYRSLYPALREIHRDIFDGSGPS